MNKTLTLLAAALLTLSTASAQVIPTPAKGGGLSSNTVQSIVNASLPNLTNNTVNASSIFTPNTYVPSSNLSNTWVRYGTVTLGATGTSWTIGVPTASYVRIRGVLKVDCKGLGGALDGSGQVWMRVNGDTGLQYHGAVNGNSISLAGTTNTVASQLTGNLSSTNMSYNIDFTFVPGNSPAKTNMTRVYFNGDISAYRPEGPAFYQGNYAYEYVGGLVVTNLTFTSSLLGKLFDSNLSHMTYIIMP